MNLTPLEPQFVVISSATVSFVIWLILNKRIKFSMNSVTNKKRETVIKITIMIESRD
jgi:hypothetical protein